MKLSQVERSVCIWGPLNEESLSRLKQLSWLVVVPENRPRLLGLRHNALKLKKAGINFVYCNDNALGLLFAKKKIVKTVIFYKSRDGKGVTGFSGTLYVFLLSRLHGVSVEFLPAAVLADDPAASTAMLGGRKFILENNPADFIMEGDTEVIDEELLAEK